MSYTRPGERDGDLESDVYVYPSTVGLDCCTYGLDTDAMLAHLRQHQANGDHVPERVFAELERDRAINDRVALGGAQVTQAEFEAGWGITALTSTTIRCPSCGEVIVIPVLTSAGRRLEKGAIVLNVRLDPRPVDLHLAKHHAVARQAAF